MLHNAIIRFMIKLTRLLVFQSIQIRQSYYKIFTNIGITIDQGILQLYTIFHRNEVEYYLPAMGVIRS